MAQRPIEAGCALRLLSSFSYACVKVVLYFGQTHYCIIYRLDMCRCHTGCLEVAQQCPEGVTLIVSDFPLTLMKYMFKLLDKRCSPVATPQNKNVCYSLPCLVSCPLRSGGLITNHD